MRTGSIIALMTTVLLVSIMLVGCEQSKGTAEWHTSQAYDLLEQHRYGEALQECNKAIQLDPNYALAYNNRAWAYNGKGQRDMAIADYEKFITLSDDPQWIEMVKKQIEELSR